MNIYLKSAALLLISTCMLSTYSFSSNLQDREIPFDTTSKKYFLTKNVTLKDVSFKDIYKRSKGWSEKSFVENKYSKEEKLGRLESKGSFTFSSAMEKGDVKIPILYTCTYTCLSMFKDGQFNLQITDITLSNVDAKGKTITRSLEEFEAKMSKFGKDRTMSEKFVNDSFKQINKKLSIVISDGEKAVKTVSAEN